MTLRPVFLLAALLCRCASSPTDAADATGATDAAADVGSCPGGAAPTADAPCVATHVVHYATDVAPILAGCAGELCHVWSPRSLLTRASSACCGDRSLVVPFAPERSYMLNKLSGRGLCSGDPMPLDAPPLSANAQQTLADWICLGALDD